MYKLHAKSGSLRKLISVYDPKTRYGYGHPSILAEALEACGAADKIKVAEAIRAMNLTTDPAAQCFPGPIKFDGKRRRVGVPMIFAQWQKGVPTYRLPDQSRPWRHRFGHRFNRFEEAIDWMASPGRRRRERKTSDPRDASYPRSLRIRIEGRDHLLGLFSP